MTKTQKKELKARLFKILHGICYVLSAIFVLVLIVASVKGCSSKKQRVNTSQELAPQQLVSNSRSQVVYKCNYDLDSTITLSYDLQKELPIFNESQSGVYTILGDFQDESLATFKSFNVSYNRYGNIMGCLIDEVFLLEVDDSKTLICKQGTDWSTFEYSTYYVSYLFSNGGYIEDTLFNLFFTEVEVNSFVFNKQFNYNAPMGISVDSPYGSGANWTTSTQYTAHLDYSVGWFLSNGQLFDTIQYWCTSSSDSDYEILSGVGTSRISQGASGSWSYIWLYYVNSQTNVSVIANYRNQVAYIKDTITNAYYYQNSSTWENDEYRYVYFLNDLSDSLSTKIQAFNNNNQYFGGSINGGSPFDVFGLVGSAFTSILPLLSIMVLPNITLGMLLFVPLVAILVFAIIKIVKK